MTLERSWGLAIRWRLLAVVIALCWMPAMWPQESGAGESWDELAARATTILACQASDQSHIEDPASAAMALFEKALVALDQSRTGRADEQKRRGAARARIVKERDDLATKRRMWEKALQDALKLYQSQALNRAESTLLKTKPIQCWASARTLLGQVAQAQQSAETVFKDGQMLYARAQSSFDLEEAAQLALESIAKFKRAQALNLDDARPVKAVAEATRLHAELTASFSKNEIVVLSNPGGARLVVKGEKKERVCPATPCRIKFDPAFFDETGGSFLNSKRLVAPLVAEVSRTGFRPETVTLTVGPREWSGRIPGKRVTIEYYVLSKTRFEVKLTPSGSGTSLRN